MSVFGSETWVWRLLCLSSLHSCIISSKERYYFTPHLWELKPLACVLLQTISTDSKVLELPLWNFFFFFLNEATTRFRTFKHYKKFPCCITIIFILSCWVSPLSIFYCIFSLSVFSKIATYIHNILSTSSLININTNPCMCYSTWNNQNLACKLKFPWWQGPIIFSPSLWYYRKQEYLLSLALQKGQRHFIVTISTSLLLKPCF